jgi:hypothetical protein
MEPFRISGHDLSEVAPATEKASGASVAPPVTKAEWLRLHPYTTALMGAGMLLVVGFFIVSERSAVAPSGSTIRAWGGANINLLNPAYAPAQNSAQENTANIIQQAGNAVPYRYIPPASGGTPPAPGSGSDSFDFSAFITMLSQGSSPAHATPGTGIDTSLQSAYAFIPTGLVSTTTRVHKRTKVQQELYDYGNEAGSYLQSLEEAHRDQAQVLKNWLEDRKDAAKTASVVELGRALWETGRSLSGIESVPENAKAPHDALAKSYMDIGANLALVPKTESDADLLKAIEVYNASADTYAKNYVALVNIFGAYGVAFSSDDSGSVFTFTPVSL